MMAMATKAEATAGNIFSRKKMKGAATAEGLKSSRCELAGGQGDQTSGNPVSLFETLDFKFKEIWFGLNIVMSC